jgi:hypothetical protein
MPVKKGGKKQKKSVKAPADESIKQMPSLVFNNIRVTHDTLPITEKKIEEKTEKSQPKINLRESFINEQLTKERKLSFWLWIGVVGIGTLIIIFWGYSLWSNFSTVNWKKTEENKIINQTSSDWDQTFKDIKENEIQNQLTKLQIKEVLNKEIQKQILSTTNTISNTASISTTTTSTNQSTTTLNIITTSSNR